MKVSIVAPAALAVALLTWGSSTLAQPPAGGLPSFGSHGNGAAQATPAPPRHILGKITAVDTTHHTITVTPTGGGSATVIGITAQTHIIGHKVITAAQIAVGDDLIVSGFPLTFEAGKIVDNKLPPPSASGSSSDNASGADTDAAPPPPPPMTFMGKVTSLSPLTVAIDPNHSVQVSSTTDTMYRELVPLMFADLKKGQSVDAQVMPGTNGPVAVQVDVFPGS